MSVQEAIQNIAIVVSNAKMTAPEHDALRQSLQLIAQTCKDAVELKSELAKSHEPKEEPKK